MNDSLDVLSIEQRDAAFRRFGETKETRNSKLNELRNLVRKIPYNSVFNSEDPQNLIKYLRGQQFDVENAARVIENVIHFTIKNPTYSDISPEEFQYFKSIIHILNFRDNCGRVIVFCQTTKFFEILTSNATYHKEKKLTPFRFSIFVLQQLATNIDAQIYGIVIINSCNGIKYFQPSTLRSFLPFPRRIQLITFQQTCCAIKIEQVYNFEEPFYHRWMWNMGKHLLSAEIRSRVHLCGENFHMLRDLVYSEDYHKLPHYVGGEYHLESHCRGHSCFENHNRRREKEEFDEEKVSEPADEDSPRLQQQRQLAEHENRLFHNVNTVMNNFMNRPPAGPGGHHGQLVPNQLRERPAAQLIAEPRGMGGVFRRRRVFPTGDSDNGSNSSDSHVSSNNNT